MSWKIKLVSFSTQSYNILWWLWIPLLVEPPNSISWSLCSGGYPRSMRCYLSLRNLLSSVCKTDRVETTENPYAVRWGAQLWPLHTLVLYFTNGMFSQWSGFVGADFLLQRIFHSCKHMLQKRSLFFCNGTWGFVVNF